MSKDPESECIQTVSSTALMQRKQPIISEMTEITVGYSLTDVSKKKKKIQHLASKHEWLILDAG